MHLQLNHSLTQPFCSRIRCVFCSLRAQSSSASCR